MIPGPQNLITDIGGLLVGNASDAALKSGVTVLTAKAPFLAAVHVMGAAPGTRETDLLSPENTVSKVDALVLSGGSAFGLDAASGVVDALRQQNRGFPAGDQRVPIVPAAILFDLANGGDKSWDTAPYRKLGGAAFSSAGTDFELGSQGAGTGATTATLKGGLGSASYCLPNGHTIGALVAVNAVGQVTQGSAPNFWAAPFEFGDEYGGLGAAPETVAPAPVTKSMTPGMNTTIAIVATDADLTKTQAKRLAIAAHDGIARSVVPAHTPLDGDLVFAAATGTRPLADPVSDLLNLGHAGALCLSRAIARGVYCATAATGDTHPTWQDTFGA